MADDDDSVALTDSQKLDQLITQVTALNTRLDGHTLRLVRQEQWRTEVAGQFHHPRAAAAVPPRRLLDTLRKSPSPSTTASLICLGLPWITKCESYFRGMRTLNNERVWMASLHLDGVAAVVLHS